MILNSLLEMGQFHIDTLHAIGLMNFANFRMKSPIEYFIINTYPWELINNNDCAVFLIFLFTFKTLRSLPDFKSNPIQIPISIPYP